MKTRDEKVMSVVDRLCDLVEKVDDRSLAADGPVSAFDCKITFDERTLLYELCGKLWKARRAK